MDWLGMIWIYLGIGWKFTLWYNEFKFMSGWLSNTKYIWYEIYSIDWIIDIDQFRIYNGKMCYKSSEFIAQCLWNSCMVSWRRNTFSVSREISINTIPCWYFLQEYRCQYQRCEKFHCLYQNISDLWNIRCQCVRRNSHGIFLEMILIF